MYKTINGCPRAWVIDPYGTEKNPWAKHIRDEVVNRNNNWIQLTNGDTGSGKTSANLGLAYLLDPSFNVDKQVAFNFNEFMKILQRYDHGIEDGRGKVILYEEAGIGTTGAKKYHSEDAIAISEVFQTFRSMGITVLISVPSQSMTIKDIRRLAKGDVEACGVNFRSKTVTVKPRTIVHYPDKDMKPRLIVETLRVNIRKNLWPVPFAPKPLWDRLNERTEEFKRSVREKYYNKVEKQEQSYSEEKIYVKCCSINNKTGVMCGNLIAVKLDKKDTARCNVCKKRKFKVISKDEYNNDAFVN